MSKICSNCGKEIKDDQAYLSIAENFEVGKETAYDLFTKRYRWKYYHYTNGLSRVKVVCIPKAKLMSNPKLSEEIHAVIFADNPFPDEGSWEQSEEKRIVDEILQLINDRLPKKETFVKDEGQGSRQFNDYANGFNACLREVRKVLK